MHENFYTIDSHLKFGTTYIYTPLENCIFVDKKIFVK